MPGTTRAERPSPSFDDLVARGVDVVIGPSSSAVAESLLPRRGGRVGAPHLAVRDRGRAHRRRRRRVVLPHRPDRRRRRATALAGLLVAGGASTVVAGRARTTSRGSAVAEALGAGLAAQDGELADRGARPTATPAAVAGAGRRGGRRMRWCSRRRTAVEATAALIAALAAAGYGGEQALAHRPRTSPTTATRSRRRARRASRGIVDGRPAPTRRSRPVPARGPGRARASAYAAEAYDATSSPRSRPRSPATTAGRRSPACCLRPRPAASRAPASASASTCSRPSPTSTTRA